MSHLAEGRRCAQYDCRIVTAQEPKNRNGGRVPFPKAVSRLYGYPKVVPDGAQHLLLLTPQIDPQDVPSELRRGRTPLLPGLERLLPIFQRLGMPLNSALSLDIVAAGLKM